MYLWSFYSSEGKCRDNLVGKSGKKALDKTDLSTQCKLRNVVNLIYGITQYAALLAWCC